MKRKVIVAITAAAALILSAQVARGEDPNPNCGDREITPEDTADGPVVVTVRPDCRVHGDVTYWQPGHGSTREGPDKLQETGQILWCITRCRVSFAEDSGGGITGQPISSVSLDMTRNGCGLAGGCERVDLRVFPS